MWTVLCCFHQPMLLPHWSFRAPGMTQYLAVYNLYHLNIVLRHL
uniref:Uncharacterized protein n=1 Tax=Arundo donax TaxID=35708 RepID=A0A0A9EF30_ARUDO